MDLVPLAKGSRLWKGKPDFLKPFRSDSSSSSLQGENITPLYDPSLHRHDVDEPDLKDMNNCLKALVQIFPDVRPEVFREMLVAVSPESRLQIVAENLLKKKAKWVNGRYRTPGQPNVRQAKSSTSMGQRSEKQDPLLPIEETFRGDSYKKAVKFVLYREFRTLSHSAVRGVLAEHNYSYTDARPTLQHLASRGSWRATFSSLWLRRMPSSTANGDHPQIMWQSQGSPSESSLPVPVLKSTGSSHLDHELYTLFVAPVIEHQTQDRLLADYNLARQINEQEAEETQAMYDCECCYSSVPFEDLATCEGGEHYLCLSCVQRTAKEALYGQGWARSVDIKVGTLHCFASTDCERCLPWSLVKRALIDFNGSEDVWSEFQSRIADDALLKSGIPLARCPFCAYGEVDELPGLRLSNFSLGWRRLLRQSPDIQFSATLFLIVAVFFTGALVGTSLVLMTAILLSRPARLIFQGSHRRNYNRKRGLRFTCRNPSCPHPSSCIRCHTVWTDPHVCFANSMSSLQQTVSNLQTLAIKRTCPKCNLSFIKSSGCNKLVCNCGYTMCYICRKEVSTSEGYGHFCQHFRPDGGRCAECERCELYGDEDQDKVMEEARAEAEKIWKEERTGDTKEEAASQEARLMLQHLAFAQERKTNWWEPWLDGVMDVVFV
ncbi:hypothetical protein K431DRAFT_280629 [Polychaeton citri CBS 116435]|uniref:RING-type domain-containing protein n=1 Tax=Polychaeton citri CBS 116435 TaxID=1314669 RepID=A0A9P4QJ70_9PEZI|nr:hypothetical protein K431DRAFT_280629 [Polychaeton citri CBS 116435]